MQQNMQNLTDLPLKTKLDMVAEARATFGQKAARELWGKLGLGQDIPLQVPEPKATQRDWPRFMVRVPPDVKAWLDDRAQETSASMNSEIIQAIRARMQAATGAVSANSSPAAAHSHSDALQGVGQFHPQHQEC